jgi:hypothetical protein
MTLNTYNIVVKTVGIFLAIVIIWWLLFSNNANNEQFNINSFKNKSYDVFYTNRKTNVANNDVDTYDTDDTVDTDDTDDTVDTVANHQFNKKFCFNERQRKIDRLNSYRGQLGNFYVGCKPCGRARLLEDKIEVLENKLRQNTCKTCRDKCDCNNNPMMFFNENYKNTDQIFCYNCLLDKNDKKIIRNYQDLLSLPSNGPPASGQPDWNSIE